MSIDHPLAVRSVPITSRAESRDRGRARRKTASRARLADLGTSPRDPVAILRAQNDDRVPELVPLRMERMLADPFAFYRGTAAIMAADLADCPTSGIMVAACGDAHLSNFGFYASPERQLVFDLNDFDEGAVAPWEWDVKRLITSAVIGGRAAGYDELRIEEASLEAFEVYASTMRSLAQLSAADRYFMHLSVGFARSRMSKAGRQAMDAAIAGAEKRTAKRTIRRLTERGPDGRLRFIEQPPTMVRFTLDEAVRASGHPEQSPLRAGELFARYRSTVEVDIDMVLAQYAGADLARRVVGVGSVGTRCYLQLLEGPDDDALVLQIKEASQSVLAEYGRIPQPPRVTETVDAGGEGGRVVGIQRVLQAVSDPFLGYFQGGSRDYYVRQFHDMKGSIELEGLSDAAFRDYVNACAIVLGRAHGQSPSAGEIVGYIGRSDHRAARAILEWSSAYADVALADFQAARTAFLPDGDAAAS